MELTIIDKKILREVLLTEELEVLWKSVDYLLFESLDSESLMEEMGRETYYNYITDKAACLHNVYDLYKRLNFSRRNITNKVLREGMIEPYVISLCEDIKRKTKRLAIFLTEHSKQFVNILKNRVINEQKRLLDRYSTDYIKRVVLAEEFRRISLDLLLIEMPLYDLRMKRRVVRENAQLSVLIDSYERLRDRLLRYFHEVVV